MRAFKQAFALGHKAVPELKKQNKNREQKNPCFDCFLRLIQIMC